MSGIRLQGDRLKVGAGLCVRLERTLRIPNDGRAYPLPPSFGAFPVYRTRDYRRTQASAKRAEFFVPLHQWEALWISFEGEDWKPNAVQVAAGGVNVLTGERFPSPLKDDPQNYIVCPLQPWLDGIKAGRGRVHQFVAAPMGKGLTLEEQITGDATRGGLQIRVYEPRPGIFPAKKPRSSASSATTAFYEEAPMAGELGIAAGGSIEQKVYPDPHGVETWNPKDHKDLHILIVNSREFEAITGEAPPRSTLSAADYERLGLPWFKLYDEDLQGLDRTPELRKLKTVKRGDKSVKPKNVVGVKKRGPGSKKKGSTRG
jgi:hypothetical protein